MTRLLACLIFAILIVVPAYAEEWPSWRGPRGDGTSTEKGVPLTWSAKDKIRWKTPIPGIGHSSPIVFGDRLFVTSCDTGEGKRLLVCVDRKDGKVLWEREVIKAPLEKKHNLNSFSSATPCTDGQHVWVSFLEYPQMQVFCYTVDGKLVWQANPGKLLSVHGFCTSPILHKDLVILNGDQDADAYIVALDKATGKERWRIDRPNKTRSYCTPILIESPSRPGVTQLVLSGSKTVTAYDADTGKPLWIIQGPTQQYVASLVYLDNTLFLTTGFPERHLMGINPDGQGDITKSDYIRWHIANKENGRDGASYVPSPIANAGHFFVVSDTGFLSCLEAKTGKRLWKEKLGKHHSASPVLVDGLFYFPDDDGVTWVLKASEKFEVVAKNPLGEEVYSSPAVSHGQLFIRALHHLYCVGN